MTVIPYDDKYRDDMIFMVLEAKDALGRVPRLNEDLLAVKENYLDRGCGFWLALDERDRVVGCVGWARHNTGEVFLHRLYVKPSIKRRGVGSALLETAEAGMRAAGVRECRVHLGEPREQWFESYAFYPKHGYVEYQPGYMAKKL
ncbi:MAG: GNAT family N-acetyltransferase [Oscillospiraceae bacterium]|nr:GNAT family N-acetyltransferase [Oscillospiraceae bacterium]